jgi:hypothetical protein
VERRQDRKPHRRQNHRRLRAAAETKRPYRWHGGEPGAIRREDLPYIREDEARRLVDEIVELLVRDFGYNKAPRRPKKRGDHGGYSSAGNGADEVNQLRALMKESTTPHDARWKERYDDIPRAVESAESLQDGPTTPPPPDVVLGSSSTIEETLAVFHKWLVLPDRTPVYAVMGTIAANLLPGDPVWLGLVAPPSSAKTEILNSTCSLPHVIQVATLTPAALLSGTPKKQHDKTARGGLLRQIGDFGVLVLKDFGSMLSMRPDAKAEVLAALRELFDGAWTRHLGTDGGKTLSWKGKVGLLFGVTGVIDSHYGVIGAMGDRFLLCRIEPSLKGQLDQALKHAGKATLQCARSLPRQSRNCSTQHGASRAN